MSNLNTASNMANPDDFYAALLDLHAGKSPAESADLNTRLVLLLANHIGDCDVITSAFRIASAIESVAIETDLQHQVDR